MLRQTVWGSSTPDGQRIVLLGLAVANIGDTDTSILEWSLSIRRGDTNEQGTLRLPLEGHKLTFSSGITKLVLGTDDMLVNRTTGTLIKGAMVEGFLFATFPKEMLPDEAGTVAIAECLDVFGNKFRLELELPTEVDGKLTYMPQLKKGGLHGK